MRGIIVALLLAISACAAPKKVMVFVALCDNATQGIIPVSRIPRPLDLPGNLIPKTLWQHRDRAR
jgi:hypothetical protein